MMTRITCTCSLFFLFLFCLSSLISCHAAVTLITPDSTTKQQHQQIQPSVVTILTKISSQNVPAFVITSVDQTTPSNKAGKHEPSAASSTSASVRDGSPLFEDLLKSPQPQTKGEEDEGVMTFRSAYKILRENSDDHPIAPSNGTSQSSSSDSMQANPSYSVFSRLASRRRVPIFPSHRARRYRRRRRPTHYVPSDVYTIESSARYPPRSLHSNAIHYQKAPSYLRDYNQVLKNNRPQGISYRPNAYSDDPDHIRDAYGENMPAVVQDYDTPRNPINSPYNEPEPRTRSYDQPSSPPQSDQRSTKSAAAAPQQQQLQPQRQDPGPLTNLPVTDVVPISNANKELVGYLPVIQIPRENDPQYRELDLPQQKDTPVQQQQQQQLNDEQQQQKEERAPEARPQVPSTYLPSLPADIVDGDVKGSPQRVRRPADSGVKTGRKTRSRTRSGRKGRRGRSGGRRSKYLSPSMRSRRQRKQQKGRRQRNNNDDGRDEASRYLTSAASSSSRYHDDPRPYQTTSSSYQRQSASSYPRSGIRESYDNVYPLFTSSSSSPAVMMRPSLSSSREYPPARYQPQHQQRLLPILNSSYRAVEH